VRPSKSSATPECGKEESGAGRATLFAPRIGRHVRKKKFFDMGRLHLKKIAPLTAIIFLRKIIRIAFACSGTSHARALELPHHGARP
jgi:hypothetical protein